MERASAQERNARPDGKVVIVIGASSGMGALIATRLAGLGHSVFGASRSAPETPGYSNLKLDVTSDASVAAALDTVRKTAGRIDAIVHCAGISIAGSLEDTTVEEAKSLFDTNYFGAVRVTRAALPVMRAQGYGQIMLVGSIGGLIGLPFIGHYSASKFALDGFMQALRTEIRPFGVDATVIHPGDYKTAIAANQINAACANESSPYAQVCKRTVDLYTANVDAAPEPKAVADLIVRLLAKKHLAPNYIVGSPIEKAGVGLKSWLPASSFEFVMRKIYGH
ncbi:MAG: SDR family oxidoreductase [Hyphomicrobiaceae bacterium]|nr:SDR family oxidoreductase [Hyphomicrobiaceae bacterium]